MKRTEHTQKWLDALRSGEYKQIRLTLFNDEGYCCIGVAAHVIGELNPNDAQHGYVEVEKAMCMSQRESYMLMSLNDSDRLTFPQIADEIEKMLDVS